MIDARSAELAGFTHIWSAPAGTTTGSPVLLLLHGTGGDEYDMLELGRILAPQARLLSPRGRVLEGRSNRFFRRLAEGVFDLDDLRHRTDELAAFLQQASNQYSFDLSQVTAVGFSNGANIAVSVLLRHPGLIRSTVLLSPMLPFEPDNEPSLDKTRVFIGAGRIDPIAPPAGAERLADLLRERGADVTLVFHPDSHTITQGEVDAAAQWLAGQ
jgi:phospholipase/carboxylesterase